MSVRDFIFKSGLWVGEGKVTFSASPNHLRFYTKWSMEEELDGKFKWLQRVELERGESNVYNNFLFFNISETAFSVELSNELLGTVQGKGLINQKTIAWEFKRELEHEGFEGFEVYELQENGDFMFHAEYSSDDLMRTIVDGRIWRKS